jgi:hypothetical protein
MASNLEMSQAFPTGLSEKALLSAQSDLDLGRNPVVETSKLAYKVIITLFVKMDTMVTMCRPQAWCRSAMMV